MSIVTSSNRVAANITGIARKNENSAAAERDRPSESAPMIVAPERETPGISDATWAIPIPRAVPTLTSSTEPVMACG